MGTRCVDGTAECKTPFRLRMDHALEGMGCFGDFVLPPVKIRPRRLALVRSVDRTIFAIERKL